MAIFSRKTTSLNYEKAAERQIGLTAIKLYLIGGFFALVWWVFWLNLLLSESFNTVVETMGDPASILRPYIGQSDAAEINTYEYVAAFLDEDIQTVKRVQSAMKSWESMTGKSWTEHDMFKPFVNQDGLVMPANRFTSIDLIYMFSLRSSESGACYGLEYVLEPDEATKSIHRLLHGNKPMPINKVRNKYYCSNFHELKKWLSLYNSAQNPPRPVAKPTYKPLPEYTINREKSKELTDLWQPLPRIKTRPGAQDASNQTPPPVDSSKVLSLLFIPLSGLFFVVSVIFLSGHKFAMIRGNRYTRGGGMIAGIAVFIGLFVYLSRRFPNVETAGIIYGSAFVYIPPLLMLTVPTYQAVLIEYIKETWLYRKTFIIGRKGGSGRLAGIKQFHKLDITRKLDQTTPKQGAGGAFSYIYLGKTYFADDYQLRGRHIGMTSEQHHILCGGTGDGKSLKGLTNVLTLWNGGGLVFDLKKEHWNTVIQHKAGRKYLLDPFAENGQTAKWNPLNEIDPNSPTARDDLARLCSALFVDKGDTDVSGHFRENALKILRGFMAHVVTTYPENLKNLATVYDVFHQGYADEQGRPETPVLNPKTGEPIKDGQGNIVTRPMTPKEMQQAIINEMLGNDAIDGAAKDAAILLDKLDDKERSGYISTIFRALDWVKSGNIRKSMCGQSDFSLREIKTHEAWVCVRVPEKYLAENIRFIRAIFQSALDLVDEHATPNATNHRRQMLFVFEEFDKFGKEFKPAVDVVNFKRSSRVKGYFVVQNLQQIEDNYKNADNFFDNSTIQLIGAGKTNQRTLERISKALGDYILKDPRTGREFNRMVARPDEVEEWLNGGQTVVIPAGKHMKNMVLNTVACYKNFKWTRRA